MKITGVVLETHKHTAIILTKQGEFKKVRLKKPTPNIGEEYTGRLRGFSLIKGHVHLYKYALVSLIVVSLISIIGFTYNYFSPSYTVIIDVSPSFELKCNNFNKIISVSTLDPRGHKILDEINLKNTELNDSLIKLLKQCESDNIIKSNYTDQTKTVGIYVSGKNVDLSNLKKYVKNKPFDTQINIDAKNSVSK